MHQQQRQPLADVRLVMKSLQKTLILTTNVQPVVPAMIMATVQIVPLAVSNHQTNQQNQSSMSVPTVNR
jgi:hypothetical protein